MISEVIEEKLVEKPHQVLKRLRIEVTTPRRTDVRLQKEEKQNLSHMESLVEQQLQNHKRMPYTEFTSLKTKGPPRQFAVKKKK